MRHLIVAAAILFCASPALAEELTDRVSMEFGVTGVLQGTSGNDLGDGETKDQTDYAYSADAAFVGALAEGHTLNVVFEAGEGEGPNDNFGARAIPNYDSIVTTLDPWVGVTLAQAYWESEFAAGALTLAVGKMDVHAYTDTNEYANDETSQFLNGMFVRYTGVLFAEHEHYYAPAIALTFTPAEWVSLAYTFSNQNTDDLFDKGHHHVQLGFHAAPAGLPGNYRIGYVAHQVDYTDEKSGETTTNSGIVLSLDQAVSEGIGLFFRYGSQNPDLVENEVTAVLSGGVSVDGAVWNREGDAFGLAYGKVTLNEEVVTEYNDGESVIEAYYKVALNDSFEVTFDLQSFGNLERADKRDVVVYGIRLQAGL